jgi:hypothetical protein
MGRARLSPAALDAILGLGNDVGVPCDCPLLVLVDASLGQQGVEIVALGS